jgi:hypothetical protein
MCWKRDRANRLRTQETKCTLKNPEEAPRVNGMAPNQEEMTMPERSQTTMPEQPQEGTVEDVTGRPDEYAEE